MLPQNVLKRLPVPRCQISEERKPLPDCHKNLKAHRAYKMHSLPRGVEGGGGGRKCVRGLTVILS
jgi:hypothetical protein